MRLIFFLLLLLLAACSPAPAPSSSQPAPTPSAPSSAPTAANADALALQRAPASGAWTAAADEGTFAARFNAPPAGEVFAIVCTAPNGALTLTLDQPNAAATTLRLVTATRTLELPAHAQANTLTATIAAAAPEHDALITMLGTPGDRFAVDSGGVITVLPWADAIATTLSACR